MSWRRRQAAIVLMLGTLAACEATSPVAPAASTDAVESALSLEGERVVRANLEYPEVTRLLVEGARDSKGGCHLEHSETLGPDDDPIFEGIAEYDPETCRVIIARFDPSLITPNHALKQPSAVSAPLRSSGPQTQETDRELYYSGGGGGGGPMSPARSGFQECSPLVGSFRFPYQRLWSQDPVGIEVTSSEHSVMYTFADGCVNYMQSNLLSKWFDTSGWFLQTHQHSTPQPMDEDWKSVQARGYQSFVNPTFADTFCFWTAGNTYSYYDNKIRGWYDGFTTFLWTMYDNGGCSELLNQYRYVSSG